MSDVDELARLRRWKAEATPIFEGLQDLGRVLGLPLGTLVTGPDALQAASVLRRAAARPRPDFAQVLLDHAGCRMNDTRDGHYVGAGESGYDMWSCGLRLPFLPELEDAERAHLAAAIAAALDGAG